MRRFGGLASNARAAGANGGGCPTRCGSVPVRAGCAGLAALRERTRDEPWFAVATGVLHGGEVEYARAQAVVEAVADEGPRAFADVDDARRRLVALGGAQLGTEKIAQRLSAAARCYLATSPNGEAARTRSALDELTRCVHSERTGIGPKAGALMREYLGDDDAVAVDRHIMDYACKQTGRGAGGAVALRSPPSP